MYSCLYREGARGRGRLGRGSATHIPSRVGTHIICSAAGGMADWPLDELESLLGSDDLVSTLLGDAQHQPFNASANISDHNDHSGCWGGLLQGHLAKCTPFFVPGAGHFKNKVCPECISHGIVIPSDRVRVVGSALQANAQGSGLWTHMHGAYCRLVNHTTKCTGPRLLIYRDAQPLEERTSWDPMPDAWLPPGHSSIRLVVALGTLRPMAAVAPSNRYRVPACTNGVSGDTADRESPDC